MRLMFRSAILLMFIACAKPAAQPGEFQDFLGTKPGENPKACSDETDEKRFRLEGYFQMPSSLDIEDGRTSLEFYASVDDAGKGKGGSVSVRVKVPGDIDDLWSSATGKKLAGYRREKATIDADALRIHAKNGTATARDRVAVVVEIEAIRQYQTKKITACLYNFVEAEKR